MAPMSRRVEVREDGALPGGRRQRDSRPLLRAVASLAAYLLVFSSLALPWLESAEDSIPRSLRTPFAYADDARFIVFVVGWVAHAIASEPLSSYEAPINHPAPRQLSGSEHFLASQLVAAPVFWATGNAVLAANAVALLSYPMAALAAEILLLELGAATAPAWIAGLLFALGPLRVPANLQVLQYLNLFLPLLAWALTRLRADPTTRRAMVVFVVATIGALSSYHMAAMLAVTGAVWGALECLRPLPGRGRFAARALAAAFAALVVLAVLSVPYFLRPEARDPELLGVLGIRGASPVRDTIRWFWLLAPAFFGVVPLAIAACGLIVLVLPPLRASRRLAVAGLALLLVGGVLMLPPEPIRAVIDHSPLRFLRAPWRFVTIAGLGSALLSAALLEWLRARLPEGLARVALVAAFALVVATQGRRLVAEGLDPVPALAFDRGVYEAVGRVAKVQGEGPLLELPMHDAVGERVRSDVPRASLEPDAMVGATLHGQPLVTGRTGYPPPHRRMLDEMIRRLPDPQALQEMVDATHLRWILLRPEGYWADIRTRRALLDLAGVEPVLERDGWVLARVDRRPDRPGWFDAIATPEVGVRSPLGTPLELLEPSSAAAEVVVQGVPAEVTAQGFIPIVATVRNEGSSVWPVATYVGTRLGVFLGVHWRPVPGAPGEEAVQAFTLPRDLAPGESATQELILKTPVVPGTYDLELLVKQWAGSRFEGTENRPFRTRVEVAERGAKDARDEPTGDPDDPLAAGAGAAPGDGAGGTRPRVRRASAKAFAIAACPASVGWISSPSSASPPAACQARSSRKQSRSSSQS
jgi:hypothetical protein